MIKPIIAICFFLSIPYYPQADSSLILTEIMFIPTSGNNEFIEIYNLSETDSFDLTGYKFRYSTSSPDIFIDAGYGTVLLPSSYAIVFEGDYDIQSGIYSGLVPENTLILKISDNAFGSTGMANTSDRTVFLLSPENDTIDVYTYSANNGSAISDEKINLNRDTSQSNWSNSLVLNGTPGFRNSVFQFEFDLRSHSLDFSPSPAFQGDDVLIRSVIRNVGTNTAAIFRVEVFNDMNFDSTGTSDELIYSEEFMNLAPLDSLLTESTLTADTSGSYQIILKITFDEDENPLNDKLVRSFEVYAMENSYNDIIINEIMYAPISGEPEWVELFNRTDTPVNIKRWRFSDAASTVTVTSQDVIIEPRSFLVLTSDSSVLNYYSIPSPIVRFNLPALNNTGDAVVVRDSLGVLIDSLTYFPSWGGSTGGRSLERVSIDSSSTDPQNWITSSGILKATPGRINSVSPKEHDLAIIGFLSSLPHAIIGEEINFWINIANKGSFNSPSFELKLYRDVNADSIAQAEELILTLPFSEISAGDSIEVNYQTNQFAEGINFYIAIIEVAIDDDSTNNIRFTKITGVQINEIREDIILNEIMYAPLSPEPEWIEIYNRSGKNIDLKNYKVADNNDTIKVIFQSVIIYPEEYLILARDSSIMDYYNLSSEFVVAPLPVLNNTNDKVILLDSLNRTIDSLHYFSSWGGTNGRSLERIDPDLPAPDSLNWKTSLSILKATPGSINSVTKKDFDLIAADVIFNPKYPLKGDQISLSAKIINAGKQSATFGIELYEDTNLDSIPDQFRELIDQQTLAPEDSAIFDFNFMIYNLQSEQGFYIKVISDLDQDITNNAIYRSIEAGVPSGAIIINEIMFAPQGGEPEWIEIYNRSQEIINVKGWTISDVYTTPASAKISDDVIMDPASYLVLTKDSTILNYHRFITSEIYKLNLPVLNNDIDGVVLKDRRGLTIDSVLYSNQWGGTNGYSLERIDAEGSTNQASNWKSSVDIEQSTPGRVNSVTPKQFDLKITGLRFEPRFPTYGQDVFIIADIKNSGYATAENFVIEFYIDSDSNNVIDELLGSSVHTLLSPDDTVSIVSVHPITNLHTKILSAAKVVFQFDEDTLNNYIERFIQPGEAKNIVIINEVMYNPSMNEPEWIELVNVSGEQVNISNWYISDVLPTPTKNIITNENIILNDGEYFIISKDSTIHIRHPGLNSKVFYVNFGNLGNSVDGVILYDYRDGIIDSLLYRSSWGGRQGFSLERIASSKNTNDSLNWSTSLSISRSTPGSENSIVKIPSYNRNSLIINEIMYDPLSGESEYIEFLNISNEDINVGGWKIEDENSNFYKLSDTSFTIPPKSYFVLASDSSILSQFGIHNQKLISITGTSSLGLVNSGELILLKDVRGNVIDSVWYKQNWHNRNLANTKGRSLEKINPIMISNDISNWSTCVNSFGGTPGSANSIFAENLNSQTNISVAPNPFSPDNDGFEDFTIINYNLKQPTAQVRIKIFDSKGRLVRTLLNNSASGQQGSVIFDGLDDEGQVLRIGIYIIFLEALNENAGVVETIKTVVVVARKL